MTWFAPLVAVVVVGTWNGNWFPSHRAEHRAAPEKEEATIRASGRMLRAALVELDPDGTNDVILCLGEMRNRDVATRLLAAIGRPGLALAGISAYRRRDRFDMQQDAIATTLPVVQAGWRRWARNREKTPPRGHVYADLLLEPAVTAHVYAVHLKSNYGQRTPEQIALNRHKRTQAAQELVRLAGRQTGPVVIAGDVNADRWNPEFAEEKLFGILRAARFRNALEELPASARATYVGRGKGRNSALDYIFTRGWGVPAAVRTFPAEGCSDHKPVFAVLEAPRTVSAQPQMCYNRDDEPPDGQF